MNANIGTPRAATQTHAQAVQKTEEEVLEAQVKVEEEVLSSGGHLSAPNVPSGVADIVRENFVKVREQIFRSNASPLKKVEVLKAVEKEEKSVKEGSGLKLNMISEAISQFFSAYGIRALEVIGGALLILFGLFVIAKGELPKASVSV